MEEILTHYEPVTGVKGHAFPVLCFHEDSFVM